MSGPEDRRPLDGRELDEFLAGRGPHRARYRAASSEQAPAALDEAVLAQARAAVAPAVRHRRARRWRLPLSIAATLLLSVGLVSRLQREAPPRETVAQAEPAPSASADSLASAPHAESPASSPAVTAAPRMPATRSEKRILTPQSAPPPEPVPAPPPPPVAAAEAQATADAATNAQHAAPSAEAMQAAAARKQEQIAAARAERQVQEHERENAGQHALLAPSARVPASALVPPPAAGPASAFVAGRYRSAQGFDLELSDDGRFRLAAPQGAGEPQNLIGHRRREGDVEVLVPDDAADASCRYALRREDEALRVDSACGGVWAGRYLPR